MSETNSPEENKDSYTVPLWMLSPGEEKTLLKEHQAWTETQCQAQFTAFAECCKLYPLMFPWKCTTESEAMRECVGRYGSTAMFDKLREEYIERKIKYRKDVEEKK